MLFRVDTYLAARRPEMLLHATLKLHEKIQQIRYQLNALSPRPKRRRCYPAHHRDARTAAMSPLKLKTPQEGRPTPTAEVVDVRRGMFGVSGTATPSGY